MMAYIIIGLLFVVYLCSGFVGVGMFAASIGVAIEQRNPVYLLGMLVTAVCVAVCAKIIDYLTWI